MGGLCCFRDQLCALTPVPRFKFCSASVIAGAQQCRRNGSNANITAPQSKFCPDLVAFGSAAPINLSHLPHKSVESFLLYLNLCYYILSNVFGSVCNITKF